MSNELQFYGKLQQSNLSVIARVYNSLGNQVDADISCNEIENLAIYIADMPIAPMGKYGIRFFSGDDLLNQYFIYWNGSTEIILSSPVISQSSGCSSGLSTIERFADTDIVYTRITNIQTDDLGGSITSTEDTFNLRVLVNSVDESLVSGSIQATDTLFTIPSLAFNPTVDDKITFNDVTYNCRDITKIYSGNIVDHYLWFGHE